MARQQEGMGRGTQGSKLLTDWHRRTAVLNKGYVCPHECVSAASQPDQYSALGVWEPRLLSLGNETFSLCLQMVPLLFAGPSCKAG